MEDQRQARRTGTVEEPVPEEIPEEEEPVPAPDDDSEPPAPVPEEEEEEEDGDFEIPEEEEEEEEEEALEEWGDPELDKEPEEDFEEDEEACGRVWEVLDDFYRQVNNNYYGRKSPGRRTYIKWHGFPVLGEAMLRRGWNDHRRIVKYLANSPGFRYCVEHSKPRYIREEEILVQCLCMLWNRTGDHLYGKSTNPGWNLLLLRATKQPSLPAVLAILNLVNVQWWKEMLDYCSSAPKAGLDAAFTARLTQLTQYRIAMTSRFEAGKQDGLFYMPSKVDLKEQKLLQWEKFEEMLLDLPETAADEPEPLDFIDGDDYKEERYKEMVSNIYDIICGGYQTYLSSFGEDEGALREMVSVCGIPELQEFDREFWESEEEPAPPEPEPEPEPPKRSGGKGRGRGKTPPSRKKPAAWRTNQPPMRKSVLADDPDDEGPKRFVDINDDSE